MKKMLCLAAFVSIAINVIANAEPMVVNGDFESDAGVFATWPGYAVSGDNPEISGWIGTGGRGINPVADGTAPFRDNGTNDSTVAFIQGTASIEQEVGGFTVGQDYVLSLDFNSRNCCGDLPIGIVSLDGEVIANTVTLFPAPGGVIPVGDAAWYHADLPFTANEESITLNISAMPGTGGDSTLVVDNIAINAVPEPSCIALAFMGALGLLRLRRR